MTNKKFITGNELLLRGYLNLQKDMAVSVFGEEGKNKRVDEVYEYLQKLNSRRRGVATGLLKGVEKDIKRVSFRISALCSGIKGERMMFNRLEGIKARHVTLKNVELEFDGQAVELDACVLTKQGVIIVEAKNASGNVTITSYGEFKHLLEDGTIINEGNIGENMNNKEYVLRRVLENSDYKHVPILHVVVFTNNETKVKNSYPFISVCCLNELTKVVERMACKGFNNYEKEEMKHLWTAINKARVYLPHDNSKEIEEIWQRFNETVQVLLSAKEHISLFERLKRLFCSSRKEDIAVA